MMKSETLKKTIKNFIGKKNSNLLLEYLNLFQDIKTNRTVNRNFKKKNKTFKSPPMSLAFDAYGSTNLTFYYKMGLDFAEFVADTIKTHIDINKKIRIYEWGCGPGRIIRHLPNTLREIPIELYGSDYNKKTVRWCRKCINGVSFYTNQLSPPLTFESNLFDCIYVFSVFTHLSYEMQLSWSEELFRVLKSDGIIIITTHGDNFAGHLSEDEREKYDAGNPVIRKNSKEGTRSFSAWHPPKFIREELLQNFHILEHIPNPKYKHLKQDIWIAKKP